MSQSQPRSVGRFGKASNWLLLLAAVVIPVVVLELVLRPFADLEPKLEGVRKTSIFIEDRDLGWRLRPNADDLWSGARIRVNAKGLRGPAIPYERTPGSARVLYLGDSVPFGYQLARHDQSYPFVVESILERAAGIDVETVNAGVGGYSPWQYQLYLAREGIRYSPDLVIVSFILNDVTEKFDLIRFGGSSTGFQLARSTQSRLSGLLSRTAIGFFGRKLVARVRFGSDAELGAKNLEELRATTLATEPDREDVREAWKITLENLDELFQISHVRVALRQSTRMSIPLCSSGLPAGSPRGDRQRDAAHRAMEPPGSRFRIGMMRLVVCVMIDVLFSFLPVPLHNQKTVPEDRACE